MSTSGSRTETFTVAQTVDAGLRYAGVDPAVASWEVEEARRKLLQIMLEWAARKFLPWFLEKRSFSLTTVTQYTLGADVIDVLYAHYSDGTTPIMLTYADRQEIDRFDTGVEGAPQIYHVQHQPIGQPIMRIKPKPDDAPRTLSHYAVFRGDDPTSGEETLSVPMLAQDALEKRLGLEMFSMMPGDHRLKYASLMDRLAAQAQESFKRLETAMIQPVRWRWRRM